MSLQYTCLNFLYVIKQSIHNGNAFILMFLIIYRWYSTNCLCKMNFFINFLIIIKEIIFLFDSYNGRGGIWTINVFLYEISRDTSWGTRPLSKNNRFEIWHSCLIKLLWQQVKKCTTKDFFFFKLLTLNKKYIGNCRLKLVKIIQWVSIYSSN